MINKNRQSPKKSLRWILALWFLTFAIVPIIFLTFYSLRKFQQTIDNELVLRLKGNSSEISVILSEFQKALSQLQFNYIKNSDFKSYLKIKNIKGLDQITKLWLTDSSVSKITIYNNLGEQLVENKQLFLKDTKLSNNSDAIKKISLHQNIRDQLQRKRILFIPDYSVPQQLDLVLISAVYSGQIILGYIKQSLSLDADFLEKISRRMQVQGILLEPNGRIIVGSHPDFLLYKTDFFSDFIKIPKIKTITLSLRSEPFGFIFTKILWGTSEINLALAASKKESNTGIENLRLAYYTLLTIMFGVLALSVLSASNVVLRPLSELIEAIQDLHLGENIIELPIKNDNEIGQLTNSFNDLSRRILATQRELKGKIFELEEANEHLKETQGQLVQSAKMASLGQLVAGVAHELNNPIGFIYSNMSHLKDYSEKLIHLIDIAESSPTQLKSLIENYDLEYIRKDLPKLITSCEEGARRTKDIVIGLRNFSRIEEKAYKPVDLHQSIDTTLNLLNSEFKNRIEIKKVYSDIPQVICNQTQINQVFMNVLSNAAQSIEGKGIVWITTSTISKNEIEKNPSVSISIQDTGRGISSELLQKIFDPFFTTKSVGKGTGLGLAISYGIIHAHSGTITVSSKIGIGTEFIITLPVDLKTPLSNERI